jgi:low affinity Fe/Cu permease
VLTLYLPFCATDKAAIQAVVDRMTRAVEKTPKAEGTINVTQPVRGGLRCVLCAVLCCSECVLCAGCAV